MIDAELKSLRWHLDLSSPHSLFTTHNTTFNVQLFKTRLQPVRSCWCTFLCCEVTPVSFPSGHGPPRFQSVVEVVDRRECLGSSKLVYLELL